MKKLSKKDIIRKILDNELERLKKLPYETLLLFKDSPDVREEFVDGTTYSIEIEAFPDDPSDESNKNLRVMVGVDDGGWRALFPTCSSIIVREDDTFV
jgi:hypothetical protein